MHQVCEFYGLIWDEAEELARLARLSRPQVTVNTAGLTPEQTALANRIAQTIHRLPPETVADDARAARRDDAAAEAAPAPRRGEGAEAGLTALDRAGPGEG